ncbi:TetR/AcrR family transcriptional regulator [Bradyrhizobium sp. BR 10261]|uniref:TetR/AcrR family transcriptional regulator n=1 Tax=Bradyrhizobium sp. BR 10261 TaxID=2749992 RepID=UPI001C64D7EF|nr:TetR/AcrR family transcriptional regulator [Bradyrhizobium sp. BR 10261]MBW7961584.1 TetR/AcrR family transcriptional regulator [Bradyrhizobium sp. BR 10261]
MPKRAYVSVARAEAAAAKRNQVVQAAARFLREEDSITTFSLDAVAKAAKVTRLTVYNQFGSRRGLLEAVFDDIARRGGLARLEDAAAHSEPEKGLEMMVRIFCEFWDSDPAVARLHDAMAIDLEFAQALAARNERRRPLIGELIARIAAKDTPISAKRDAVDLIYVLTSCATFRMLSGARSVSAICALLTNATKAAVAKIK